LTLKKPNYVKTETHKKHLHGVDEYTSNLKREGTVGGEKEKDVEGEKRSF